MIKIAILDADTPIAGETIRILVHHPEADLVNLYAPGFTGRNVATIHHGLIGEPTYIFSDKIDTTDIDVAVITEKVSLPSGIIETLLKSEDLKVITLDKSLYKSTDILPAIGISEINRKAIVRGAKKVYVPSPLTSSTLIALVPLARYMLLNSYINITSVMPKDIKDGIKLDKELETLEEALKQAQISFNQNININLKNWEDLTQQDYCVEYSTSKESRGISSDRAILTQITLESNLSLDEIENIYNNIYDDHNFSFISHNSPNYKEVEGTHKTVIYLDKPDDSTLKIDVLADARLRGGAGDIVHLINLLFGLHEKTGLHLKPSVF